MHEFQVDVSCVLATGDSVSVMSEVLRVPAECVIIGDVAVFTVHFV